MLGHLYDAFWPAPSPLSEAPPHGGSRRHAGPVYLYLRRLNGYEASPTSREIPPARLPFIPPTIYSPWLYPRRILLRRLFFPPALAFSLLYGFACGVYVKEGRFPAPLLQKAQPVSLLCGPQDSDCLCPASAGALRPDEPHRPVAAKRLIFHIQRCPKALASGRFSLS